MLHQTLRIIPVRLLIACLSVMALLVVQQGHYALPAAAQVREPAAPFEDVTRAVGISNTRRGDERAIGQAWGDFDNDGWQDLYVTDTQGPNSLFRNVAGERFERVDDPAVALADAFSGGAIFADYDNDGWADLYVLNWGENVLLRNVGGRFEDVTANAGVGGGDRNSQTAAWGDYDGDGYLDLYIANWACYPRCGRPQTGEADRLYHNNGDGTFSDVSRLLGARTNGAGFVGSFVDFDNDGDLDIYVVNDEFIHPIGNRMWRNDGPGCNGWCFTEIAEEANTDARLMGMGLATTDYDRDGFLDFFFSNAGPMQLLRNRGDGTFVNVGAAAGVAFPQGIGWGSIFLDYNNDGWQDLYIAIMEGTGRDNPGNPLFRNMRDGTFALAEPSGAQDFNRSLGVAAADYNQDGFVDFVVGNIDAGYKLYRNTGTSGADNRWIGFKLVGAGPVNRDAVGARVYVSASDGSRQLQEVTSGASLGAGNELALHFGLGTATVDRVEIVWPDGTAQTYDNVAHDRGYTLTYPLTDRDRQAQRWMLFGERLGGAIAGGAVGVLLLVGGIVIYKRNGLA